LGDRLDLDSIVFVDPDPDPGRQKGFNKYDDTEFRPFFFRDFPSERRPLQMRVLILHHYEDVTGAATSAFGQ